VATNEAKIVVNIERGAFKSYLKGMESDVAASGKRMKTALSSSLSAGLGNVKNSMKGMLSGIGGHIKTLATFGGAIGAGMLVKDALHLQTLYRNIAYNINKIPGQAMKWQDVQAAVERSVEKTGAKAEDMARTFDFLFKEIGDVDVAKNSLEAIGTIATATGGSVDDLAEVVRLAVEKFNIGTDRLPDALANFESLTGIGGKGIDELGRRFGMMAGAAADAGFTGEEGMRGVLGLLMQVDNAIGERAEPAIKRMFEVLRHGGTEIESIEKKMGRKFKVGEDARERMKAILAKGGPARAELMKKLTGDAYLAFKQIAPAFDTALEKALASGKSQTEATTMALEAFDRSILGSKEQLRSFEDNAKEAARRLKDDPALQLQKAMNKLQKVMTSPQALASIKKLMDVLPPLAENMAKLLSFILDHPLVAGGAALVGKGGASFASGYLGNLLFGGTGGGGKGAAGPSGAAMSTQAAMSKYTHAQLGMTPAKMSMWNGKMITTPGRGIPMVPPSETKMKVSGQQIGQGAVGVIAAAGIGVAIGTEIANALQKAGDDLIKRQNKDIKRFDKLGREISGIGGPGETAAERRKKGYSVASQLIGGAQYDVERYEGVGGKLSMIVDTFGALFTGGDDPFTQLKTNTERSTKAWDQLNENMGKRHASSLDEFVKKLTDSGDRVSKALDKIDGGKPTRGPVTKDPPTPGAAPKSSSGDYFR
jgi:hypothetical protein